MMEGQKENFPGPPLSQAEDLRALRYTKVYFVNHKTMLVNEN
jgi:hypothetical protein